MFEAQGQSFSWALKKMKEGCKVKRKDINFPSHYYIDDTCVPDGGFPLFTACYSDGMEIDLKKIPLELILAEDWIYYGYATGPMR